MLFNSSIFALFFAAVLLAVWAARGPGGRKLVLLAASYLFYAHWDYRYLVLLWISTIVDYSVGGRLHAERDPGRRRAWLLASLVCNLGLLALFKYGNFLLANLAPLWSAIGVTAPTLPTEIPIGISFYTFQTLSYTIDVYRRKTAPCRSPLDFALFVAFFPQLVAGPIVRAGQLLPQLARIGRLRLEAVSEGMQRFLLGLVKKLVIADGVALYVDHVFASPSSFSAPTLWFAAYGFAL